MTGCPDCETMARFMAGTASRSERRVIVRHLLARCTLCASRLRSVLRPPVDEGRAFFFEERQETHDARRNVR